MQILRKSVFNILLVQGYTYIKYVEVDIAGMKTRTDKRLIYSCFRDVGFKY